MPESFVFELVSFLLYFLLESSFAFLSVWTSSSSILILAHFIPSFTFLFPSGVRQAHILGLDLAVFRTESGQVGVIDAYCPHLGANIAAGGTVEGDSIKCPFHGWEFNCDGVCVRIPYAKNPEKIPSEARVTKYTSMEINDQILIW